MLSGKQTSFYGSTLAEAQLKADDARRQGRHRRPGESPRLEDWLAEWLDRKREQLRPQTWLSYEVHARKHIIPAIGDVRLDELEPAHFDRLHARLLQTVRGTTAHHVHMTLTAALGEAERRHVPVSDVLRQVRPPRRSGTEISTLTRQEVTQLLEAIRGDELEALYVVAVTLGAREGELLGLQWRHVDLKQRKLTIVGSSSRTIEGTHVIGLPKTAAGTRTLTLPRFVVEALERAPRRSELVWPGADGTLMPAQTFFSRRWVPLRERAGIRPVSFHALRHTAATLALEDGVPPHVVAAMLGHASVATTLRLYAHVTRPSTAALADAIDARYGAPLRLVGPK